jgi:hypothetical protein
MGMALPTHRSTQWRIARFSFGIAALAIVAAAGLGTSRRAPLLLMLTGLVISNAGFQLRFALQEDPAVLRAAVRARFLAASLLVLGATLVGGALAFLELHAPAS